MKGYICKSDFPSETADGSSSSSASDTKKPSTTKKQFCDVLQLAKKYPVTVNVQLKIESLGPGHPRCCRP